MRAGRMVQPSRRMGHRITPLVPTAETVSKRDSQESRDGRSAGGSEHLRFASSGHRDDSRDSRPCRHSQSLPCHRGSRSRKSRTRGQPAQQRSWITSRQPERDAVRGPRPGLPRQSAEPWPVHQPLSGSSSLAAATLGVLKLAGPTTPHAAWGSQPWWFCSDACRREFLNHPEGFAVSVNRTALQQR